MKRTAHEKTSAGDLEWTLETPADGHANKLALDMALHASAEVYICDRLWDWAPGRKRIPDPYGVYRFVDGGRLLLVFAQSPIPKGVNIREVYQPFFSRVRAGETWKKRVLITLPVDEYSALARDVDSPTAIESVSRATLVLAYRLRSTMPADPTPPPGESATETGYIVHDAQFVVSTMETDPIQVKRRKDDITRFTLPPGPGASP